MSSSKDYSDQLKCLLSEALTAVDNVYDSSRSELTNEILGEQKRVKRIDSETGELFNLLNYKLCETLIRKKLPLRVRLFTKVACHGYGIRGHGSIMIAFSFGNICNNFECVMSTSEIKKLLS